MCQTFHDKDFQVAPSGWRVFWARAVSGGEVFVGSYPLVGWMTQESDRTLRVLPVVAMGDGTADALGRGLHADEVRVVGPGESEPDADALKDGVRMKALGDARWEARR